MISISLMIVTAYLLGSLSSAIMVCKIMRLPDPRLHGSRNPGTTNVLRIGGKLPAILTLTGDVLKGVLPVLIALLLGIKGMMLGFIAVACCLGHIFPLFFKFKGGKGVATAFGALFVLSPLICVAVIATWLLVIAFTRYVSLASMVCFMLSPIYVLFSSNKDHFIPLVIMAILIVLRHWSNIKRLRLGVENKIKF